tara:strand:+ start:429 stop:743 length:315 start_codon:yes stop_codon:yes gene_type:complete
MRGESRLWGEVLLLAINDVARSRTTREMAEAVAWFKSSHCEDICFLLGCDPQVLRKTIVDLARRSPAQRKFWMEKIKEDLRGGPTTDLGGSRVAPAASPHHGTG